MPSPHILVVRLGSMGDIIHALPAVATLKHSFPRSRLSWAIERKWTPLLEGNPFIDETIPVDRGTWAGVVEAWRRLRAARFDLAVDFQGLIKSALVAAAARADRVYGYHQSQTRERLAALFYSRRVAARSTHVIERNLELAIAAGASSILRVFPLPAGVREGELPPGSFVLACPLGGWKAKQWPLEHYSALARLVASRLGLPLVVNGPPQGAEALSSVAGARAHLSDVAGLIDATRRATAVVGIDSGPLHLAAALGKPGVAIFGPTDPARNGPCGESIAVLRGAGVRTTYKRGDRIHPSMREVTPEAVLEALCERLGRPA